MSGPVLLYDQIHHWLTSVVGIVGADAGCFHLKSRSGDRVVCQAVTDGLKATHLSYGLDLTGCPAIAEVLTTGETLAIDNAPMDLRVAQVARERFGLKSVLYQPVRINGSLEAVAILSFRRHHPWTQDEVDEVQRQTLEIEEKLARVQAHKSPAGTTHQQMLAALPGVIGLVDEDLLTHQVSQVVDQGGDLSPQSAAISVSELVRDSDRGHEFRRALTDIISGDLEKFEALMRTGDSPWWVHARAIQPTAEAGDAVMALVQITPMPNVDGALEVAQERARLEALGRIAGSVAHEMNNSLQSINLASHELQETGDITLVQDILRATERSAFTTGQLLTFARQAPKQFKTVELADFLTSRMSLIRRSVGSSHVVGLQLGVNATVSLDVRQIELALVNLCRNAADASPSGSQVTLECGTERREGVDWAYLAVSDQGEGMPSSVIKNLGKFQKSSKPRGLGTGIGLSVVKQVADNHGGEIVVRSPEDGGARVVLFLPLPATSSSSTTVKNSSRDALRVLIVDDEVKIGRMIARTLTREGMQTECCSSLRSAMTFFDEDPSWPGLVILDMKLGDGSGLTFFEHARAVRADLPFIAISGYADRETVLALSRAECPLLSKPFSVYDLLSVVRRRMNLVTP